MDIHRIRFVPLPAPEINALAFSHRSNAYEPTPHQLRLALGRSNGDIEIWNPQSRAASGNTLNIAPGKPSPANASGSGATWSQETILRGGKDRTIEGMTWTQDLEGESADGKKTPGKLRLFSIGYSTYVTEWDLATGRPLRHTAAGQSEVWCMAAQPRWEHSDKKKANKSSETANADPRKEQLLALGCGDGSIVLLSTDDGELTYLKTLQRSSGKKPRVMSLAWYGREKIVAGYSDSMIRVFEVTGRGRLLKQMSLGTAGKGGPSETLVWAIKALRDDTFVSGDSSGEIKIWDAKNFTLLQRLKSHLADVLSLAVNHDSTLLLSGGMDRRTVLYQKAASKGGSRWAAVSNQRVHENDVKAMATFESKQMSVVISGGLDAMPIVNPLRTFGQENHRALPAFPNSPTISSSPKARLLLSWWDREVNVWHVAPRQRAEEDEEELEEGPSTRHTLVARLAVQGEESITSARISPSGDLVAIASMSALKLFYIRPRKSASTYRITKLELPKAILSAGAKMISFSPDGKWLVVTASNNHLRLYRLVRDDDNEKQPWRLMDTVVEFRRNHGQSKERAVWGTHGDYGRVISTLAWSGDSRILVTCDNSGTLETFVLEGAEDPDWTAAPTANGKAKTHKSDDDSSEDESDDEDHPEVILGQHWKVHTEHLPRLPAPAVVLSFRPSTTSEDEDANLGLHATRHNPAPHSHQLPHGEDRLIAVTSKQDVLEFNAMTGKLTDWAKKNPPSVFPVSFRNVLDTASGALWDVDNQKQRVWIHGSSWLWMFDLSRDFPDQETISVATGATDMNNKKRKRDAADAKKRVLIKNNAGAGSRIRENEQTSGAGMRVRTHKGEQMADGDAKETTFDAVRQTQAPSDDESDGADGFGPDWEDVSSDDEDNQKLVALRRGAADTDGQDHDRDEDGAVVPAEQPHYWHTFKYRPIIGFVPLEGAGEVEEDKGDIRSGRTLEVALVERPLWEADLKPRWEGPQEYGKR